MNNEVDITDSTEDAEGRDGTRRGRGCCDSRCWLVQALGCRSAHPVLSTGGGREAGQVAELPDTTTALIAGAKRPMTHRLDARPKCPQTAEREDAPVARPGSVLNRFAIAYQEDGCSPGASSMDGWRSAPGDYRDAGRKCGCSTGVDFAGDLDLVDPADTSNHRRVNGARAGSGGGDLRSPSNCSSLTCTRRSSRPGCPTTGSPFGIRPY